MTWSKKLEKPYQSRDMEIQTIYIGGLYTRALEVTNFFPLEVYIKLHPDGNLLEAFYFDEAQDKVILTTIKGAYRFYLLHRHYLSADAIELQYEGMIQLYQFEADLPFKSATVKLFSRRVVS